MIFFPKLDIMSTLVYFCMFYFFIPGIRVNKLKTPNVPMFYAILFLVSDH